MREMERSAVASTSGVDGCQAATFLLEEQIVVNGSFTNVVDGHLAVYYGASTAHLAPASGDGRPRVTQFPSGHPPGYFSAEPSTRPPPGYLGLAIVPSGLFGLGTPWVISLLVMTYASVLRSCCAGTAGQVIWGLFGDQ